MIEMASPELLPPPPPPNTRQISLSSTPAMPSLPSLLSLSSPPPQASQAPLPPFPSLPSMAPLPPLPTLTSPESPASSSIPVALSPLFGPPIQRLWPLPTATIEPLAHDVPEISIADFFDAVLSPQPVSSHQSGSIESNFASIPSNEHALDSELTSRAVALGITLTATSPSSFSYSLGLSSGDTIEKRDTSSGQSASSLATYHARTVSSASDASASTALTDHSANSSAVPSFSSSKLTAAAAAAASVAVAAVSSRRRSRTYSFSYYDKYLRRLGHNLNPPKFFKEAPIATSQAYARSNRLTSDQHGEQDLDQSGRSLFSVSTKRSFISLKRSLRAYMRWKKPDSTPLPVKLSCICCRDDFEQSRSLQTLSCGHVYCTNCLLIMVNHSITDESKMPPRCCDQPLPSAIVKNLLGHDQRLVFMRAVVQYSTPWEARIFCPRASCGEFIPPRRTVNHKHPFQISCTKCRTNVCIMCRRDAHPIGQDCPDDWELEAVLKIGETLGWRRCYKCRTLVELSHGCTHMTCRCKAQFCYICGAVWETAIGCPNHCNGEEEMERRRVAEELRVAELEAAKLACDRAAAAESWARAQAEQRSRESPRLSRLLRDHSTQLYRFLTFSCDVRWRMWTRHSERKIALSESFVDQDAKLRECHARAVQHLEDRQVAAEMELRSTLDIAEKSIRIRLKHMEAYCEGLGRQRDYDMPPRQVTERDLRELGQQYKMLDNMETLNQAKINVLRERQAKSMEEILKRHEDEIERLTARHEKDLTEASARDAVEEDALIRFLSDGASRLRARARLGLQVAARELEVSTRLAHHVPPLPDWGDRAAELMEMGIQVSNQ